MKFFEIIKLAFITFFGFFLSLFGFFAVLPAIFVFYTVTKVVYFLIKLKLRDTFTRPTGLDIIQGLESKESIPFINTIGRFDGPCDIEKVKARFTERILKLRDSKGNLIYRKYMQAFEEMYGFHVFKDVDNFDINNHIRQIDATELFPEIFNPNDEKCEEKNNQNCEEISSQDEKNFFEENKEKIREKFSKICWTEALERVMSKYCNKSTPEGQPQWELVIFEDATSFTVIFRINHAYSDGIYFMRFLLEHFADDPVECKLPYNYHPPNPVVRFLECFWAFCLLPFGLFRLSFSYEKNPLHGPKLSGEKMFLISDDFPTEYLKEIKTSTGTSINAILFSCLSASLASHFRKNKCSAKDIVALVPVSMQNLEKPVRLKNRFGMIGVLVPTFLPQNSEESLVSGRNPNSAVERLREMQASCDSSKSDPSFLAIYWLLTTVCAIVPSAWVRKIFSAKGLTSSLSNVAGPSERNFYLIGGRKSEFFFWIPDRDPMGIGVSIAGFAGKIRVGLMADKVLINTEKEGHEFLKEFLKEVNCLRDEISKIHTVIHFDHQNSNKIENSEEKEPKTIERFQHSVEGAKNHYYYQSEKEIS